MKSCLVIGAGIAGLMAATELQTAFDKVTVLDKGRGVGGRMASRRLPFDEQMGRADHGAQYLTVRSDAMRCYVDQWLDAGIVREWSQGFYDGAGEPHFNGVPRYIGVGGMTAVAKHLAKDLNVHTATRVVRIEHRGQFMVTTEGGEQFSAETLILTPPAEQTLTLIDSGNITLEPAVRASLEAIQFNPCFAVMAILDRPSAIHAPGGVWPTTNEPISWVADNQQKGVSDHPSVTIHAGPQFTCIHWESDRAVVAEKLIAAARPLIGDGAILSSSVQRWKYSIPTQLHPEPCLVSTQTAPIIFAGDAFEGARVEGAALSGLTAAARLRTLTL
ncbi:MAG: NAD(P)/FAD-dependent oxidoreductase [Candidatus Promineifilaceae bacterium]